MGKVKPGSPPKRKLEYDIIWSDLSIRTWAKRIKDRIKELDRDQSLTKLSQRASILMKEIKGDPISHIDNLKRVLSERYHTPIDERDAYDFFKTTSRREISIKLLADKYRLKKRSIDIILREKKIFLKK